MFEINIANLFYLFFRLAPFIIVSFFAMSSIINQDIKGVIYIIGLIATCFIAIIIGNLIPEMSTEEYTGPNEVCNIITLGDNVSFSKIPLGQTILMYTFFYFVYVIATHNLALTNIPTLIFFPLLIMSDLWWNFNNNCYNTLAIIIAFIVGGSCGVGWSAIIDSFGQPSMMYYNVGSNANVCSRPSKQLFKCTFGTGVNPQKEQVAADFAQIGSDILNNKDTKTIQGELNHAKTAYGSENVDGTNKPLS
jgi:hypothetical protein